MSNTDSFIDEVTEEVRRDRLYATFRRYGWIGALVVIAIVGGAAWTEWQRARAAAEAQALGDAILTALEANAPQDRVAGLTGIAAEGPARAVTALLLAAEQDLAGDPAAAAATLDALAADPEVPVIYRNLAALKSVLVQGEGMAPQARRAALAPLAAAGAPFRTLALEQIALADLAEGDTAAAIAGLVALAQDAEASEALRDRAQSLIVALGGDPSPSTPGQ